MPLRLEAPRQGRTPFYRVRGTFLGIRVDRTTELTEERAAKAVLKRWRDEIIAGTYRDPAAAVEPAPGPVTFRSAALAYLKAGGERKFMGPIIEMTGPHAIRDLPLEAIDQIKLDLAAEALYPNAPAQTRNRQFYTPVSAVLKHVGVERRIKRPKGWRGTKRTFWLSPEQTFKVFEAATARNAEFGLLCILLNYTGMRISEALDEMTCECLELDRNFAYIGDTKTDTPRAVYLPPVVVAALANHPRGLARRGKVFGFHYGSRLREMLHAACNKAGIELPRRTAFHVFRHNYGTWMRRYAGLDDLGLLRTGVWADRESVDRYSHSETTEEARRAIDLPTPTRAPCVERKKRNG